MIITDADGVEVKMKKTAKKNPSSSRTLASTTGIKILLSSWTGQICDINKLKKKKWSPLTRQKNKRKKVRVCIIG